jgi:hypothetical protein
MILHVAHHRCFAHYDVIASHLAAVRCQLPCERLRSNTLGFADPAKVER